MKRILLFTLLLLASLSLWGQSSSTTSLGEATVSATRQKSTPYGYLFYPTAEQKASSTNAYNLLSKLPLPAVHVSEIDRSVTALSNKGTVVLQINGAPATVADLLALDPKNIKHIDFIERPGIRYAVGTACVINIRVQNPNVGYTLGTDATQELNARKSDYMAYVKLHLPKSELALNYQFTYSDARGYSLDERAVYHLADGTERIATRRSDKMRNRKFNNNFQLRYTLVDSTAYTLQATLSTHFYRNPLNEFQSQTQMDDETPFLSSRNSHGKSFSPALDVYFNREWAKGKTLTANLSLSQITTDEYAEQTEVTSYAYDVAGRTYGLSSELTYEATLGNHRLQTGFLQTLQYRNNHYTGDTESIVPVHNAHSYGFVQWLTNWKRWDVSLSLGTSRERYRQGESKYAYWIFRPKASLSYKLSDAVRLSYDFDTYQHLSRVAFTSGTRIRRNSMEWLVGNPDLRPNRVISHRVDATLIVPHFFGQLSSEFRQNPHANMALYLRTPQNEFIYTQTNQRGIDMFYVTSYFRYTCFKDKLSLSGSAGLFRFFNRGDNYRHHYTAGDFWANAEALLGRWTLTATASSGFRFLEGEHKGIQGSYTALKCGYRWGNCSVSLVWRQPLNSSPKTNESYVLNAMLQKQIIERSGDIGNNVLLNFTWRLHHGRKALNTPTIAPKQKTEAGILK